MIIRLQLLLMVTVVPCLATIASHAHGSSGFLLFTDSRQGLIYKANSKGYGLLSSPKVIIHSSVSPQAVTYDPKEQRVYWSDTVTRTISRAFLNDSSDQKVLRYVQAVAIAVDSVGRNLYWADNKKGSINVARLDGTHRKRLVRTTRPTDIALDLTRRQMYWSSDGFHTAVIETSSMDGTNRHVIVSGLIYGIPSGLCLDNGKRMLYWTEKKTPDVYFVSLDNPGGQQSHFQTGSSKPFRLTLLGQRIYWTDRGNYYYHSKVASVNATTKRDFKILINNMDTAKGIYGFDGDDSLIPESNCSRNNGGCSHLCLLNPRDDVCACSNGMVLKDDGKTCHYKEFLLVVDHIRRKIFHKCLDDLSQPKTPLALRQRGRIMTVDFDPQEHKIYWTNKRGVISRAFINGSSIETVVNSDHYIPRGLAVDAIGRNIYWFDSTYHEIGVCKLDGSYQKILMTLNDQPKAMVLDTSKRLIYWATTTGRTSKIERAQMNGDKREVILRFPRKYRYYSPRALAVDSQNNRLYWVDNNRGELCYTETNPKTGQIHHVGIPSRYLHSPYSLALKEDFIYWGNAKTTAVYRVNKTATRKVQKIVSGVDADDLHVYHNNTDGTDNNHPCAQFNGWCSHLCLLKPGGYSCVCPERKGSRPCYTSPVNQSSPATSPDFKPSLSPSSAFFALETSSSVDQVIKITRVPTDYSSITLSSLNHASAIVADSSGIMVKSESTLQPSTSLPSSLPGLYLTTLQVSLLASSPPPPLSLSPSPSPSLSSTVLSSLSSSSSPVLSLLSSSPLLSSLPSSSMPTSSSSSSLLLSQINVKATPSSPPSSSSLPSPSPLLSSLPSSSMPTSSLSLLLSQINVKATPSSPPSSSSLPSPSPLLSSLPSSSMPTSSLSLLLSQINAKATPSSSSSSSSLPSPSPLLSSLPSSSMPTSSLSLLSSQIIVKATPSSPTGPQHEFQSSVQVSSSYFFFTSSSQSSSSIGPVSSSLPDDSFRHTRQVSPTVMSSIIPPIPGLTSTYLSPSISSIINYSSTGFPLSPSSISVLVRPHLTSSTSTRPSFSTFPVDITPTTLPSSASIPIKKCHPDCQVGETCVQPWYQCIKIGENKVSLLFKMNDIQLSNDTLKNSVSRASTEYCTNQSCLKLLRPSEPTRSRRTIIPDLIFQDSDVLVLNSPVSWPAADLSLVVIAILVPIPGSRRVITKQNLCKLIWQARHLINRYMEGPRIIRLDGQTQPACVVLDRGENHGRQGNKKKETATTISVSILSVALLLLLLLFLAMVYIRRRRSKPHNVPRPYHTQISFNNQGFLENDYEHGGVESTFSNPTYAEIDQVLNNQRKTSKSKKILRTPSVEPVKNTNIQRENALFQTRKEFWDPACHVRPRPRRTGNEVILNPSSLGACADVNIRSESPEYSTPIAIVPRYMPLSSNRATKSRDGDYAHLKPGTWKPPTCDPPSSENEGSGFHEYERIVGAGIRKDVSRQVEDTSGVSGCRNDGYDHLWRVPGTRPGTRDDNQHTYDHLRRNHPQHNRQYTLQLEKDDDDDDGVVEETII